MEMILQVQWKTILENGNSILPGKATMAIILIT